MEKHPELHQLVAKRKNIVGTLVYRTQELPSIGIEAEYSADDFADIDQELMRDDFHCYPTKNIKRLHSLEISYHHLKESLNDSVIIEELKQLTLSNWDKRLPTLLVHYAAAFSRSINETTCFCFKLFRQTRSICN